MGRDPLQAAPGPSQAQARKFLIAHGFPEPELETAWRECLMRGDMPTHFASPEYFREPPPASGKRFAVLALESAAAELRVVGALTGIAAGRNAVSGGIGTPQICVDASADPQTTAAALLEGLKQAGKSARLVTAFSWFPIQAVGELEFAETITTGTAALDLRGGPEKVFAKLKGRSQVRRAMAAGVEVRQAAPEDLPEYYAILKGWSASKRLPCPTFEAQQEAFRLTGNRRLFLAIYQGKIVAGSPVRFYPGAIAEYAWNASLPEFRQLRPNDLLHWRIIEWACQQGMHTYLLGATHTFLLKYSDRLIPTYRYVADQTFLKTHTRKEQLAHAALSAYQNLPEGPKRKVKRLMDRLRGESLE